MPKNKIISLEVDVVDLTSATNRVLKISEKGGYVCVANVHMIMEAYNCKAFERLVNSADMVIPDGKPLSVYQFLMGYKNATQVRGRNLFDSLIEESCQRNLRVGFFGGSDESVLNRLEEVLQEKTGGKLCVPFSYSPPFRQLSDEELESVITKISKSNVNILFVGIGCPKQEIWMSENSSKLSCAMVGVGAVFDFVSGTKREAPKIIYSLGLEWLFRLLSEPKRLWRRYLLNNTKFIYLLIIEAIKKRGV